MPGVPTATLLQYAEIVDVDMAADNDVNFADVEDYGHRVVVEMDKAAMGDYLGWERAVGSARPSAKLDASKEAAFKAAVEAALSAGFVDIDGVVDGLHFGTANLDTNADPRLRAAGVSANDIPLCFVLYKLYGSSTAVTLDKIYNLEDSHGMLANSVVATAIAESFKAAEAGALDVMFRDLLAADPHRFFDASGIPFTGIFETNADVAGAGSWNLTADDTMEIKLKLIFHSQVSKRGVAGREHLLSETNSAENQQVIISPDDYFFVRLQLKATDMGTPAPTVPAAPTGLSATAGDGSIQVSFTAGSNGGSVITNYKYSTDGSAYTAFSPAATSSPVTISGLTNGTSYTVTLKAVNAVGDSVASASVTATPAAAGGGGGGGIYDEQPVTTPITFSQIVEGVTTNTSPSAGVSTDYFGIKVLGGTGIGWGTPYTSANNEELRNLQLAAPLDTSDPDGDAIVDETMASTSSSFAPGSLTGKAVLIQRGLGIGAESGQLSFKIYQAQQAGAKAVIIYNSNSFGDAVGTINVGGMAEFVNIPAVFVGNSMGHRLVKQVRGGTTLYAKYKYESAEGESANDKFFVYANIADEPMA